MRLLGGLAIRLHASGGMHPALARSYADIDLVCARKAGRDTSRFLVSAGYEANERFNAMNGSERMIFYDRPNRPGTSTSSSAASACAMRCRWPTASTATPPRCRPPSSC